MTDCYTTITGVYHITQKPGLPQVGVCHGFYVLDEFRGKGFGHQLMKSMMQSLKLEQYDYAMLTTAGDNHAMHAVLIRAGWTLQDSFYNRKTGRPHQVWSYTLTRISHN